MVVLSAKSGLEIKPTCGSDEATNNRWDGYMKDRRTLLVGREALMMRDDVTG